MEPEFWHERWEKEEIGFHQHEYNAHMKRFMGLLGLHPGARILVPLCGKSLDMLWLLEQRYRVTGIEISRLAVESFFGENGLEYEREEDAGYSLYRSGDLQIHCADFFDLGERALPPTDAVYDRASLVALPPAMRAAYVQHLDSLIRPGTRSLLLSLDYPPEEMRGPPFAVTPGEVGSLYGDGHSIRQVHSEDCLAREPRFRKKGLTRLEEHVFLLEKNRSG